MDLGDQYLCYFLVVRTRIYVMHYLNTLPGKEETIWEEKLSIAASLSQRTTTTRSMVESTQT